MRLTLVPTLALSLLAATSRTRVSVPERPTVVPNPNVTPAGRLKDGVLTLDLETVHAKWHREGGAVPGTNVDAFAEVGKPPSIPAPLIRVPAGSRLRVRVHNTFSNRITYFLPTSPTKDDSIVVAPGATAEISGRADKPGNFIYRATDQTAIAADMRMAGAMGGAFVVDTAGVHPLDRVFVILMVPDSTLIAAAESHSSASGGRISYTINGVSWPNTERIFTMVGDTLRWRIINASADIHPMHLHGFYFRVDQLTGLLVDKDGQGARGRNVVTERLTDYSAMNMTWSPNRPGNWVFHCHFAIHLTPPVPDSADSKPMGGDHDNHALNGMVGLVLGIAVSPGPVVHSTAVRQPARQIRLVAVQDSAFPDSAPMMRFVVEENGRTTVSRSSISPSLYLERNQPVAITVVNHLPERTSVHWHGLEIDSYYDGVGGLSGTPGHVAPVIAPGDSFRARLTPPRSGTFMYHSHANDVVQQTAGLVGALIVQDSAPGPRAAEYEIFLKGSRDINAGAKSPLEINGTADPDTIVLHAGKPAVFRFMSLALVDPEATITLTSRGDSSAANLKDTSLMRWTPIAKDGADLPRADRVLRAAKQIMAMGETYDFSFTPARRGQLRIEVRDEDSKGRLLARVPVRVE